MIEGGLGAVDDGVLPGWAWDRERPDARVVVTVLLDGAVVAEAVADEVFPSLLAQGYGDGGHGFSIPLPDHAADAPEQLEVQADGTPIGSPPPLPPVIGRVGEIVDGELNGWAVHRDRPDERLVVDVLLDGRRIAQGTADVVFPSLLAKGHGDGGHGFVIALPGEHRGVRPSRLRVRAGGVTLPVAVDPEPELPDEPPAGVAHGEVALVGRAGWLFELAADQRAVLDGAAGDPAPHLGRLADALDAVSSALGKLGIRHVVGVVPQKLFVHTDLLPAVLPALDSTRVGPRLVELAHGRDDLDAHDLLAALRGATHHGSLYDRRSEALNVRGGFFATRALLKQAGLGTRGLTAPRVEDAAFATAAEPAAATSAELPALQLEDGSWTTGAAPAAEPEPRLTPDHAFLQARRMPGGDHLEVEDAPAPRIYEHPGRENGPRVLLLGPPELTAPLTPWLAEAAGRLAVIGADPAPLEQIELELPDLVLQLVDEWGLRSAGEIVDDVGE